MKVSYGVVWRERDRGQAEGHLTIGPHSLLLSAGADDAIVRELSFEWIAAAELRIPAPTSRHSTLVLKSADGGPEIEIESAVSRQIMSHLLERLFVDRLGDAEGGQRILVALKLKPGRRDAARELLSVGPPFDPKQAGLARHEVFLLDDEVLFLFETYRDADVQQLIEPSFWQATESWRELTTGEARLAEQAYTWTRGNLAPSGRGMHPGLGF